MATFTRWLYFMALIVWLGAMLFFSMVAAPALFHVLSRPDAGRAVGAIFPTYYAIGYGCGLVLVIGSVWWWRRGTARGWWGLNAVLAAVMLAATLYAGMSILPRAAALRPQVLAPIPDAAAMKEFDGLHRLAVNLNGLVLVCGLALSVVTAGRLRP